MTSETTPYDNNLDRSAEPRRQRPATVIFTQAVLALQAFVALFATLVAWSFARNDILDVSPAWIAGGGIALILLLGYAAGKQKERAGRILGWILQVPMLVAGLLVPAIAIIGAVFLGIWILGLRLGGRIDRERKEREDAAAGVDSDLSGEAGDLE